MPQGPQWTTATFTAVTELLQWCCISTETAATTNIYSTDIDAASALRHEAADSQVTAQLSNSMQMLSTLRVREQTQPNYKTASSGNQH
mmetsp:Transcript_37489/g.73765  ORF Transcript_37489/g.73765 Transcript_37489/m.73765 type:complete len:88 (-) Transcript_37489:3021-3284(-)